MALLAGCCSAQPSLARNPEVAGAIKVLDAWIQTQAAHREDPGLSIAIIHDQSLLWTKGYGFADLESRTPATPATLYRIASCSKLFTATAVLQLRDGGKLQLDDPVGKYLPWFRIKEPHPDSPPITIEELLTHTSGLARELPLHYWNDLHFPTRQQLIEMVPREPAVFPPQTERKYSNLAFAIAGELVRALSGEPYDRYVEQHILQPLGMRATRVIPDRGAPGLATGYRVRVPGHPREKEDFIDARALTATAGFASSVEDLALLVELQFRDGPAGGAQILKGSTLREMQRLHWINPDWQGGMGLAWEIHRAGQQVRVGKAGSAPGYQSQIEIVPAEKFGVVVLANGYDANPMFYVNQALSIVAPAVAHAAAPLPKPAPAAGSEWSKYEGIYTWKHVDAQIMVVKGELIMITPESDRVWEGRVRLVPAGPHTFRMRGGGHDGELLKFELNASGAVTGLTAGDYYRERKR